MKNAIAKVYHSQETDNATSALSVCDVYERINAITHGIEASWNRQTPAPNLVDICHKGQVSAVKLMTAKGRFKPSDLSENSELHAAGVELNAAVVNHCLNPKLI